VLRALRAKGFHVGGRERRARAPICRGVDARHGELSSSPYLKDSAEGVGTEAVLTTSGKTDSQETRILQRLAGNLWRAARDPFDTPVEFYLASRGLNLRLVDAGVLRFHPACPRGKLRQPAMVALVRNQVTDQPQAVHRTFLLPNCRKDGQAMMLGPAGGGAIKLCQGFDGGREASGKVHVNSGKLHVCEGIETGIGLLTFGYRPLWALGAAGELARLPILPGVEELIACSDHDANHVGQRAAYRAVARWRAAGKAAREIRPTRCEWDFADVAALLATGSAPNGRRY
jgi:hypothetical protein